MEYADKKFQLMNFWKQNFDFTDLELKAFAGVNRGDFILDSMKSSAYDDVPLPLLRGKTVSQPTTVMIMTSALELQPGEKVFEIGTGSGYQSAIIAKIVGLAGKVITMEIMPELVMLARENLKKTGFANVFVYEDDGSKGMREESPFDKIIITAACKEFPKPLLEQLKPYGVIVGPVGNKYEQELVKGTKRKDGSLELEFLGPFLFSPLYGKYGFEE